MLLSENGPQYSSREFKDSQEWVFQHIESSPEYPQSNSLVERSDSKKKMIKKAKQEGSDRLCI